MERDLAASICWLKRFGHLKAEEYTHEQINLFIEILNEQNELDPPL